MKKYDQYKDSGVEWLGEIPEHWELSRLGTLLNPISTNNRTDLPLLSITREKGVILRDLDNEEDNHNFIPDDLSNYKMVKKGQFGMNKMKAWQGSYGISDYDGIVSPAYFIFEVDSKIQPKYFHASVRSKLYISFFGSASDGVRIGQWDLSKPRMKQIPFLIPPKKEQTEIANFLDDKTAKIDKAIAIKQKQIELLKERRQILIHKAVTRGLNDDVKLKESSVEWIGDIPEHWEVLPITKYSTRIDYRGKTPEKVEDGIFLITTKNIKEGKIDYENSKEYVLDKHYNSIMSRGVPAIGDILFTMEAPLGMSAVVNRTDVAIAQRIIKFNFCNVKFDSTFVNYSIQSEYFQTHLKKEATGSTAQGIKASKLHKLKIITPKIEEQQEIVEFIETSTTKIATAISLKEQEIEKLKEYKMSLIDAVVTGRVRVVS